MAWLKWLVLVALVACGKPDKIGVAECDAYLDKAAACATQVGGATGDSLAKMRAMMADAWKQSAADSAQRDMLPKTCEAAIADAKKQVPQCEW
jgi:glutamine synthetase